jgi:hypothetical protein
MEAGEIVERGAHASLLAQGGRYARMWQLQNSAGDEDAGPQPVADEDAGPQPVEGR